MGAKSASNRFLTQVRDGLVRNASSSPAGHNPSFLLPPQNSDPNRQAPKTLC